VGARSIRSWHVEHWFKHDALERPRKRERQQMLVVRKILSSRSRRKRRRPHNLTRRAAARHPTRYRGLPRAVRAPCGSTRCSESHRSIASTAASAVTRAGRAAAGYDSHVQIALTAIATGHAYEAHQSQIRRALNSCGHPHPTKFFPSFCAGAKSCLELRRVCVSVRPIILRAVGAR